MATVDELEDESQQQHERFLQLFGSNPATGAGFTDVSHMGRQIGHQTQQARADVIGSQFSTTVIPSLGHATASDHQPFNSHARTAATAAEVSDASAQVNTRGAQAIMANSRSEAAQIAAIPDPDSPEGMMAALNAISNHQAKSLDTVQQSAAEEQRLGKRAAGVQAVDFKTDTPHGDEPDKDKDKDKDGEGDGEDGKKGGHSGEKSFGKGSDTHIEQHGDPEKQWGHPTDPHEAFPNVPGKTGTFDGDHGKWEWHGPGRQGEAYGSQTPDGVGGHAGVDAWAVKGDANYSRDVFGNPLNASASGEIGAHSSADATLTDHGVSAGGDAFVGGELSGKADYSLGPVDLSLGAAGQIGAGGSAHFDAGMETANSSWAATSAQPGASAARSPRTSPLTPKPSPAASMRPSSGWRDCSIEHRQCRTWGPWGDPLHASACRLQSEAVADEPRPSLPYFLPAARGLGPGVAGGLRPTWRRLRRTAHPECR